jgi:hypothetical protein
MIADELEDNLKKHWQEKLEVKTGGHWILVYLTGYFCALLRKLLL